MGTPLQIFRPKDVIALIMIACVDALHIDQPVCDPVCEGCTEQGFDLHVLDGAALHGKEIIALIHPAPVNDLMQLLFQDAVQPDAGAAAIALPEGWATFISTYFSMISSKVDCGMASMLSSAEARYITGCEPEIALGNVHGTHLPAKG